MIEASIYILLICIVIMYLGFISNRSLPEKLMFFSCSNNYLIIVICFMSLYEARESYVDIAYIYVLFNFMINFVIARLFKGEE